MIQPERLTRPPQLPNAMRYFFAALAVLVGMLLPFQAGINATLRQSLGHPLRAGLTNFIVGSMILAFLALASGNLTLPAGALRAAPPWAWLGGCIGATVVISAIVLAPKLGGALLFALIVFGQLSAGVLVDHFGLVGYERHPITLGRILGVTCVFLGVILIQRN